MARNGVGIYNLPSGQPVVTGTTISSTVFNVLTNDLANALTTSIASDGQTAMAANLPMGGFKLTGVGAATVAGDALRFENIATIGGAIQAQTYTAVTTTGTSTAYSIVTSPAAVALAAGQRYRINLHTPSGVAPTLVRDGLAAIAFKVYNSAGAKVAPAAAALPTLFDVEYDGVDYVVFNQLPAAVSATALPGYLFGCTLSTAGASATMSVSAGQATDSTGVQSMALTAIAKTTSAWAVGTAAGGLDTGAIAINSWYHYYVIRRPDTGVTDVIFSLNATAPALPTNYTQFRRIGSGRTNASSQWFSFIQRGDSFLWDVAVGDFNGNAPTVSALTTTSVPLGIIVEGLYTLGGNPVATVSLRISNPALTDVAPTQFNSQFIASNIFTQQSETTVFTNTSSQIRVAGSSANNVIVATRGWIDTRGRAA